MNDRTLVAQPGAADHLYRVRATPPDLRVDCVEPYGPVETIPPDLARECTILFADIGREVARRCHALGLETWVLSCSGSRDRGARYDPLGRPGDDPFWDLTTIVTAHISGSTESPWYVDRIWDLFTTNLGRRIAGAPQLNVNSHEDLELAPDSVAREDRC